MKTALLLIDWIGCPRNVLLKLRVEDYLKANGWSIINGWSVIKKWSFVSPSKLKSCNLIIFFSCSAVLANQRQSLRIIKTVNEELARLKNHPMFVVTGCLPSINRKELLKVHKGPAFGPLELQKFDTLINANTKIANIPNRKNVRTSERVKVLIERRKWIPVFKICDIAKKGVNNIRQIYCIFQCYVSSLPQFLFL